MLKSRFLILSTRFMLASAVFIALIIGSSAQIGFASPLHAVSGYTVTIPANSTGTIPVQAIALNPGSNLSSDALSIATQPLAADNVRTALYYGIDWGYAQTSPYQVALAVWWVQDSSWQSADHATAEQIGATALNSPGTPSWNPDGVNLLNLVQSGQVSISPLSLTPSGQYPSLGSGSLQVTNTSANSINVYLPYGTVFGGTTDQALVWAGGEGSQGPVATPTNAPEATAVIENTPAPASTPASTGKGGGQPPAPPAPPAATTRPKTVPGKGKSTPVASDTPAPPADTATPLPTATTEPTVAPTDTPEPAPTEAASAPGSSAGTSGQETIKGKGSAPAQESQSESAVVPSTPSIPSAPTGEQSSAQAGKSQSGTNAAGGVSAQPDGSLKGPVLPNATATPVGDSAGSAPPPVGTAGAPQAVTTSQPGVGVPNAQATGQAVIPDAQATKEAFITATSGAPTAVVKPTDVPPTAAENTGNSDSSDGASKDNPAPPVDLPPTEEVKATPAPTPAPAPNDGGATVDASTDNPAGGSSNSDGSNPAGGGGSAPNTNPTTGAGRSDLTTWLGLFAALMVLGGGVLRYKGKPPVPVRAESRYE